MGFGHSELKQWARTLAYLELPLRRFDLCRPASTQGSVQTRIPSNVYQTWPDNRAGRSHLVAAAQFQQLNPTFSFQVFTNSDQQDYMHSAYVGEDILRVFSKSYNAVLSADIFRYCILRERGGVYIDFSKQLSTPLLSFTRSDTGIVLSHERNLIPEACEIAVQPIIPNHKHLFVQWCILSESNNPFLNRMLDNICRFSGQYEGIRFPFPKQAIVELTGPIMWTRSIWDEIAKGQDRDFGIVGFDYGESEFPRIPGSYVRFLASGHYSQTRDQMVLAP